MRSKQANDKEHIANRKLFSLVQLFSRIIQIQPGEAERAHRARVRRFFFTPGVLGARVVAPVLCMCLLLLSSCGPVRTQTPQVTQAQNVPSTTTYVALGASDTFGTGTGDPYNENWPLDLSKLLGPNAHLINLGVPSMTLHVALTAELPIALASHPNLVTIWLAVNDLATNVPLENYRHDLDTMLTRLQTGSPGVRIEVGNMPDLTSVPFFQDYDQEALRQQIVDYNAVIASVVQQHHAILVDLSAQGYNLQEFPEYISGDGLHPSALGYLRLAQLFFDALQQGHSS